MERCDNHPDRPALYTIWSEGKRVAVLCSSCASERSETEQEAQNG